jgi:hypothetical protein
MAKVLPDVEPWRGEGLNLSKRTQEGFNFGSIEIFGARVVIVKGKNLFFFEIAGNERYKERYRCF